MQGINKVIEASNNNGNNNKARLVSLVTRSHLDRCDSLIEKVREERFNQVKQRQVRKFPSLFNRNRQDYSYSNNRAIVDNRTIIRDNVVRSGLRYQSNNNNNQLEVGPDNSKWVINLSKTKLTKAQESLLAKGPNFAISLVNMPNLDYITAIESVCPKLKEEDTMELRADINSLLRRAKVPKDNLTKEERIGLSHLKRTRIE